MIYQNVEVNQYINQNVEVASQRLIEAGLQPIVIGSGNQVFAQSPSAGNIVVSGSKVFLQTGKTYELPNLKVGRKMKSFVLLN